MLHDNYSPVAWGGTGERWDFMQLHNGGRESRVHRLIQAYAMGAGRTRQPGLQEG